MRRVTAEEVRLVRRRLEHVARRGRELVESGEGGRGGDEGGRREVGTWVRWSDGVGGVPDSAHWGKHRVLLVTVRVVGGFDRGSDGGDLQSDSSKDLGLGKPSAPSQERAGQGRTNLERQELLEEERDDLERSKGGCGAATNVKEISDVKAFPKESNEP